MTTTMSSQPTSDSTASSPTGEGASSNGRAQYARKLAQVESLLWEAAERLNQVAERGEWPPPGERLCEMAAVLVRIAVTIDVLGHEPSSHNGKAS
jgi:hypothetical protein